MKEKEQAPTPNDFKETEELVRLDIITLLKVEPFFANLIGMMKIVISTMVPVAGVAVIDGDIILYIHPTGYSKKYKKSERVAILKHEALHVISVHYLRRGHRHPKIFNYAADLVVNQMVNTVSFQLPSDALVPKVFNFPEGLTTEEYYQMLLKDDEWQDKVSGGRGDEEEGGEGDGSAEGSGGGSGESLPNIHPTWDLSTDVSNEVAEAVVKTMVQDAYDKAEGKVPGNVAHLVSEILESKVNWRAVFRNFTSSRRRTKRKPTWKKRNRRLGRKVMGYRKSSELEIYVFYDSSGSVDEEQLAMFNGELLGMHRAGATITVIECDSKIQKVYPFNKNAQPEEVIGRGGTDFRPPFEYLKEHRIAPDCIVYLTDGYGTAPTSCSIPVLWALTPNGKKPHAEGGGDVTYGTVIKLED